MTRVLYAIGRPDQEPEPHELHRNTVVAWQRHLDTEATGHTLLMAARRAASFTGVRCRAYHLVYTGVCPDQGL
jgi:hypothetical protein